METTNTDKMLKDFFSEQKQEIEDNGFSKRLLQNLPEQTDRRWIVWAFAIVGLIISGYIGINSNLFEQIMRLFKHISIYYLLGTVFCFPLIGAIVFYFAQNRTYRLI